MATIRKVMAEHARPAMAGGRRSGTTTRTHGTCDTSEIDVAAGHKDRGGRRHGTHAATGSPSARRRGHAGLALASPEPKSMAAGAAARNLSSR